MKCFFEKLSNSLDRGESIPTLQPMTPNQRDSISEQLEIISDLRFFLSQANSSFEADKNVETYSAKVKAASKYDKAVKALENFKKFNNL